MDRDELEVHCIKWMHWMLEGNTDKAHMILERILAALTSEPVDLHSQIMDIQVDDLLATQALGECFRKHQCTNADAIDYAYKLGCRDTRHAAAEIVVGRWRKVEP